MKLYDLRIEYDRQPFGIAVEKPRFSWKLESQKKDTMQKDYHIIVKKAGDESVSWDSGVIMSDSSVHIEYSGEKLWDETEYIVTVAVTA